MLQSSSPSIERDQREQLTSSQAESLPLAAAKRPLRICLLLDSYEQPQWVYKIVEGIRSSAAAEIVMLVMNSGVAGETERKETPRGGRLGAYWRNRRHLLYAGYTRLDERVARVEPDAFTMKNIRELVAGCPVLEVAPAMTKHTDRFSV